MATSAIQLNGVSYAKCSNEQRDDEWIGVAIQAANGARRFARRTRKQKFTLAFEGLTIAELNTLRNIQALTTTFTYTNGHGTSFTVMTQSDSFSSTIAAIDTATDAWYDATLVLYEA